MTKTALEHMAEMMRAPDKEELAQTALQRYSALMFAPIDEKISVGEFAEFIAATRIMGDKLKEKFEANVEIDELGNKTFKVQLGESLKLKEGF